MSRRIFAREALVYQRLHRRPDWLIANDAAVRDAQRVEDGPVARIEIPQRVPIGYHAWWVDASELDAPTATR